MRQLREEVERKRRMVESKQAALSDLTEDFGIVQIRFIEERKQSTKNRNDNFDAYSSELRKESRIVSDNLARVETCNFIY